MSLETFINEIMDITDCREQFMTKIYFKSGYYKIVAQRLYIEKMVVEDGFLNILFNDGKEFSLKITDDLEYWKRVMI